MQNVTTFITNFFNIFREYRWVMVSAFTAMLLGLEMARHTIGARYEFDQAYRVLLFGVALPLLAGITLSFSSKFELTRLLAGRTATHVKQRVLVATHEMLLGAGIESLLLRQKELDLVGITPGSSADLIKKITRLKPEIVILDEGMYLVSAKELLTFLNDWPEMRLVVVSANENRVQVYNKRQIRVTQSMDLVEMMCRT